MKKEVVEKYENRDKDWWAWRETMEAFGIKATLTALGFPDDPKAIYYNIHTGDEETLEDLTNFTITGPVPEKDRANNLAIALEHWLPKTDDPNPVIARSKALTEEKVKNQIAEHMRVYVERNENKEEFLHDVYSMGGTLDDGGYDNRGNKTKVYLNDGREFVFSLSEILDRLKKPRVLSLFES